MRIAVAILVLTLASGGCSRVAPSQSEGAARISLGEQSAEVDAAPVARLFALYAVLAALAYDEYDPATLRIRLAKASFGSMDGAARQAVAGWRVVSAHEGALPCVPKNKPGCTPLPGLGFQVWHSPRGCAEVVIAFRGTNFDSQDDWTSNLRWFQSRENRFDQYDQVREHIVGIVDRIRMRCGGRIGQLVAVGHSLGGGLAQQAAYKEARIGRVYAFDPSFVTGYYDVRTTRRSADLRFLEIDRVYEHGEILAYPRFVLRHLYPPTECDPTIRSVRFNLLRGRASGEHSIDLLTENLLRIAAEKPASRGAPFTGLPRPGPAERRALGCAEAARPGW